LLLVRESKKKKKKKKKKTELPYELISAPIDHWRFSFRNRCKSADFEERIEMNDF
jgi:hypothetical protein